MTGYGFISVTKDLQEPPQLMQDSEIEKLLKHLKITITSFQNTLDLNLQINLNILTDGMVI